MKYATLNALFLRSELTEQFESLPKCRRILKTTSSQCSFPACSVTGDFKPLQCDILNGLHSCWCTDKSGTRVPGTLMTAPEEPDCIHGNINLSSASSLEDLIEEFC